MSLMLNTDLYRELSDSEKKVIDYIETHENKVESFSITMIANRTFTSTATVSRAIKKMGFSGGISELRYSISINKSPSEDDHEKKNEDIGNVNQILAKSYRECMYTIDNIEITDILKVIDFIKSANRIILCALGSSAMVAQEFQEQLLMLGYTPILMADEVWLKRSNLVKQNDLVFIITTLNTRPVLFDMANRAKHTGAKVVTCVCKEGTSLQGISDITIIGHTENIVNTSIMSQTSRLSLMIITRTITEYLALYE